MTTRAPAVLIIQNQTRIESLYFFFCLSISFLGVLPFADRLYSRQRLNMLQYVSKEYDSSKYFKQPGEEALQIVQAYKRHLIFRIQMF